MIVYKTTNLITGKIYIGQDSNNNPKYLGSGRLLKKSIKKYGKEHFKKEILETCESAKHLNERELYWITTYDSTNKYIGYNMRIYPNGLYTPESRKAQRCKGHTIETKSKISIALKKYVKTKEHREALSLSHRGKTMNHLTKEQRAKFGNPGEKNPMYGKKHSVETRKLISEKATGRPAWNKGKDNSIQYISMLTNYINILISTYNIDISILLNNLNYYVSDAKANSLIPKNKGLSIKTLRKYKIIE